jgi:hypothetical protein
MRITSIYGIKFNEAAKEFEPVRYAADLCVTYVSDIVDECSLPDEIIDCYNDARKSVEKFCNMWEQLATEADKKFTLSPLAKQARIIKYGKYYYQFFDSLLVIDVSENFENLLDLYGIHRMPAHRKESGQIYFWKKCEGSPIRDVKSDVVNYFNRDFTDPSVYYWVSSKQFEGGGGHPFTHTLNYILSM